MVTDVLDQTEVRKKIGDILGSIVREMTSAVEVEVSFAMGEKTTIYKVSVPQECRGKLIGAQGKNITSLRNLVGAMAGNHGFRAIIDLVV